MQPVVSVVIPSFNRASLLPRALDSVFGQNGIRLEIIVVDDGSTDDTREMTIRRYPQVRYAYQDNSGPSSARNRGMGMARGEFIAFLDSDDEWPDGSLQPRLALLENRPDVDMVFSDWIDVIDGIPAPVSFFQTRHVWNRLKYAQIGDNFCIPENFFDCQLIQPLVQTSTVVLRANSLRSDDRFVDDLRIVEDWEFWLRFGKTRAVGFVDRVLSRRHIQSDNLTSNSAAAVEMNVRVARHLLRNLPLSQKQKRFVRRRMADDLFDWGLHVYWRQEPSAVSLARNLLLQSFLRHPSLKTLRCLAYSCVPRLRRLRSRNALRKQ